MAVVTTKSKQITDRDASPRVPVNAGLSGGLLHVSSGTVEAANGDSIASKFILAQVPSNAYIKQVLLTCDGGGTTGAGDIGIYKSTVDGGAVVDADFFASAQAVTAALTRTDVTHESTVYGKEDIEKPLWEALGLSADPNLIYDVVMTLTTATDAASTITLDVTYSK